MQPPKLTPEQALNNLYQAARIANLTADQHEAVKQSAIVIQEVLQPKEKKNDK